MGEIANKILEGNQVKVEGVSTDGGAGANTPTDPASPVKDAVVEEAGKERLRIEAEAGKAKNNLPAKNPEELEAERLAKNNTAEAPKAPVDMSDADFLELLKKRTGRDIKSLDELITPAKPRTPEEIEADRVANKEKAIQYGLQSNVFSTKDLEAYYVDNKRTDRDIALEMFTTAQLKEDSSLTTEQIEENFKELYFEDEEESNWKRKRKAEEMSYLAQQYREHKHSAIIGAEDGYENHTSVEQQAVAYKGAVDAVVSTFEKKLSFNIDGKDYFANVSDSSLLDVQEHLLSSDMFERLGKGSLNEGQLKQILNQSVIIKELPKIMDEVARSYATAVLEEAKLGRKGILPNREAGEQDANLPVEYQGKAKNLLAQHNAQKGV